MTKLEQTIVATAMQRLRELKDYMTSGTADEKANAMQDLFPLVELGKIQDSGLSEEAAAELVKIESEALALIKAGEEGWK